MKLSLPSKFNLGNKAKPEEENKEATSKSSEGPKYSSAEVKLAVIAIEVCFIYLPFS